MNLLSWSLVAGSVDKFIRNKLQFSRASWLTASTSFESPAAADGASKKKKKKNRKNKGRQKTKPPAQSHMHCWSCHRSIKCNPPPNPSSFNVLACVRFLLAFFRDFLLFGPQTQRLQCNWVLLKLIGFLAVHDREMPNGTGSGCLLFIYHISSGRAPHSWSRCIR